MVDSPPNPTQVRLTSPRSARAPKILAAVVAVGALVGGTNTVARSQTWWEVVLWVGASLLVILVAVSIGATAAEDARASAALRATAVPARAEVVEAEYVDEGDDPAYRLTLWITPPGGVGFPVEHRCDHLTCVTAAGRSDAVLDVLVDPTVRTWAVVH
ncbi:hypothetical protein LZG04_22210 [Saccharothrix sp. S26]|uniref:hypothetical protein n=1 Tax=Saccharothrix sp. S26 TaxID=2907215 RepID=UPI001F18B95B|nr:hypothetical protein [Saccharothrix sp. S26]MCE6997491.1 hypothetical protein [Saccharothrix sp. S26]